MELEEMKTLWENMSQKINKQELLTNQLIMEMTQQKYSNKFSKLMIYEGLGTIVCFVFGVLIVLKFNKLDTWYLQLLGGFVVAFMFVLPILTMKSLVRIRALNLSTFNYTEVLVKYAKQKKRLLLLQRLGIMASLLLFFAIMPVFNKIMNNKDMFASNDSTFPWIFVGIVFVLVAFFARWGYGCYKSITNSAEGILKELEE